jgi:hypothetical protein
MSNTIQLVDKKLRDLVLRSYDYSCCICSTRDIKLDLHHIIPRRLGGPNTFENLRPVCKTCHTIIAPFHYKEENQEQTDKELTFIAKLSKMGTKRILIIPTALHLEIEPFINQHLKIKLSNIDL